MIEQQHVDQIVAAIRKAALDIVKAIEDACAEIEDVRQNLESLRGDVLEIGNRRE